MAVLCQLADPTNYRAFDWDLHEDPRDLAYWIDLFASHPGNIKRYLREGGLCGDNFEERWRLFRAEYDIEILARRQNPNANGLLTTISLCEFRQSILNKYGWCDPYVRIKEHENRVAAEIYPRVIEEIDLTPANARWEALFRGLLAGNMFDLGAPHTIAMYERNEIDYNTILARIPQRPWFIDHADSLCERFNRRSYRQALFFVDNAGSDIVLGVIPVVREMARNGIRVVMAANSAPALNDITIAELNPLLKQLAQTDSILAQLLAQDLITTVSSGGDIPLIDLSRISDECNAAAAESDLLILEGMGRGVESNWCQQFRCDVWRVALVKDATVAKWIGSQLFDAVCRFDPGCHAERSEASHLSC